MTTMTDHTTTTICEHRTSRKSDPSEEYRCVLTEGHDGPHEVMPYRAEAPEGFLLVSEILAARRAHRAAGEALTVAKAARRRANEDVQRIEDQRTATFRALMKLLLPEDYAQ